MVCAFVGQGRSFLTWEFTAHFDSIVSRSGFRCNCAVGGRIEGTVFFGFVGV